MNKEHEKKLAKIADDLDKAKTELDNRLTDAETAIEKAKGDIVSLKDDLQGKYDEMSDTAQEGDKGTKLQEDIEKLGSIEDHLDEVKAEIESADFFDDPIGAIKEITEG
jgi:predicted  nucleic acid-binding Zn-ribbon protein